jgi:hypothetical protein
MVLTKIISIHNNLKDEEKNVDIYSPFSLVYFTSTTHNGSITEKRKCLRKISPAVG